MIYFAGTNLAMAAMPKTGTRWVCSAMGAAGLDPVFDHSHGHDVDGLWIHKSMGRRIFTALRHPATWLASIWAHSSVGQVLHPPAGPCGILNPYMHLPWRSFVGEIVERPWLVDSIYSAYAECSDIVLKTEGLCRWTRRMLTAEGINDELSSTVSSFPAVNETQNKPNLTREQYEAVGDACRVAMSLWLRPYKYELVHRTHPSDCGSPLCGCGISCQKGVCEGK